MFETIAVNILLYIIPTRYTTHRVYFYLTLLYMFRALLSPIVRSTKTTVTTASGNRYTVLLSVAIVEESEFGLFHDNNRQLYGVTVTRFCSYSCFCAPDDG